MTEEQRKKIKKRLTLLTIGVVALLAVVLVVLVVTKKMNTVWFPVGVGVALALYWIVSDILPVLWLRLFEEKTEEQKRSYYIYALIDAVGLGGLLYFIMSLSSMTGALVYVVSVFMKKRFHDEYLGVSPAEADAEPEVEAEPEDRVAADTESEGEADLEDGSVADAEAEEMPGETAETDAQERKDGM